MRITRTTDTAARRRLAFTLVEVMAATALTMMLGAALLSALTLGADAFRRTEAGAATFREARAAMQMIAGELQRIVTIERRHVTGALSAAPAPTVQRNIGGKPSFGFLARLPEAAQGRTAASDICLVAYFLENDGTDTAIYRRLVPSDETFLRLTSGGELFQPADLDPATAERIAGNVLEMDIAMLDASFADVGTNTRRAASIQIDFRVIDPQSAERLRASPAARDRIERQSARDFTLRWKLR